MRVVEAKSRVVKEFEGGEGKIERGEAKIKGGEGKIEVDEAEIVDGDVIREW